MKYYIIKQIDAIGNGSSTTIALVVNPQIEAGAIRATKVGEIDWVETHKRNDYVFKPITKREIMVIGNATCEETELETEFGMN